MKRRKLTAILLAIAMVLALSGANVFAANGFGDSTNQTNRIVQGNGFFTLNDEADENIEHDKVEGATSDTEPMGASVPVYGILGVEDDEYVNDPYPDDGSEPPEAVKYQINVSVPVKIIWAAFKSDGGAITSPNYMIKNNSSDADNVLSVTIVKFAASASSSDTDVNANLTLTIIGELEGFGTDPIVLISANDGFKFSNNTVALTNEFTSSAPWNFTIGGAYPDNLLQALTAAKKPTYDLTLKFTLVPSV